jgi:hypothetical protein
MSIFPRIDISTHGLLSMGDENYDEIWTYPFNVLEYK